MSYANGTTHYNLPQTVGTDKRDWFDTNAAFAALDAALYAAATGQATDAEAITALQQTVGGQATDIAALQTASSSQAASISALQTIVNGQATQIADVRADALDMIESKDEGTAQVAVVSVNEGEYFRYNDVLYIATQDIAVDDTIVPNTNCRATNVGTELETLAGDIDDAKADITALEDVVNRGSFSKPYGGSSTYGTILDEFATHIDYTKIRSNTKVTIENNVFNVVRHTANMLLVSCNLLDSAGVETIQAVIMTSGSQYALAIGGDSTIDRSSTALSGEVTITIEY